MVFPLQDEKWEASVIEALPNLGFSLPTVWGHKNPCR